MKKSIQYIFILWLFFASSNVFAQYSKFSLSWNLDAYEKHTFTSSDGQMPYRLLKPRNLDLNQKYPLVIMLHGEGEGIGSNCSNQQGTNVCNLGWGGKMHLDSINKHPAFVVFPQTYGGNWSSGFASGDYSSTPGTPMRLLIGLLTDLFNTYNIDLNRVYIHGLSAGGGGVWEMATRYPQLFAAVSPHSAAGNSNKASSFIYNPIWTVQGGSDSNPSPGYSQQMMNALNKLGRTPIYTLDPNTNNQDWPNPYNTGGRPIYSLIPNEGHVVWWHLYDSPVWQDWMFAQSKLHITVFGETGINTGDSVKIGVAPGFDEYQWTTGSTKNEIYVKSPGQYQVRFRRKAAFFSGPSVWTDWSDPVIIYYKNGPADTAPPSVPGNLISTSKTFNSVSLSWSPSSDNTGVAGYEVYSSNKVVTTTSSTNVVVTNLQPNTQYTFTVKAYDISGNRSAASNPVTVTTDKAVNGLTYNYYEGYWNTLPDFNTLTAKTSGYVQNFSIDQAQREDGFAFKFDGYINIPRDGAYTFYTNSDDGSKLYIDNAQVVSNDGVHAPTEQSGSVTLTKGKHAIRVTFFENSGGQLLEVDFAGPGISKQPIPDTSLYLDSSGDAQAPTAPANLVSTGKTTTSVDLSWNASTDNVAVTGYNVYVNGAFNMATASTAATVSALSPATTYTFTVKAKDAAGNLSSASNSVNVTTDNSSVGNGVMYSYYEGTWDKVPDFNTLTPVKTGNINNFDISPRLRDDYFAFKFQSYIDLPSDGQYTFYTSSDDGSNLYINNVLIVNNDGLHGNTEKSGNITLSKGRYPITVTFLEKTGQQVLLVSYAGPGISKKTIPDNVLFLSGTSGANHNPVLASINNTSVKEGKSVTVNISATDSDGDNITLSSPNLPSFATLTDNHNGTGKIVFNPGFNDAGNYSVTVQASDNKGGIDSESFNLTVEDSTSSATGTVLYRANAGGYSIPDNAAIPWEEDSYGTPSGYCNVDEAGDKVFNGTDPITIRPEVAPGTPMQVFQSERALGTGTVDNLQYDFPVSSGSEVEVRLYFAENWFTEANKRKFNVAVENQTVLTNYDIFAEVGHDVGTMKSFSATSDGTLSINFIKVLQNPKINGIEIVCMNDACSRSNVQIARNALLKTSNSPAQTTTVTAYPNPFVDNLSVEVNSSDTEVGHIVIFDKMGEKIHESYVHNKGNSELKIDLSTHPLGIYLMKIFSKKGDLIQTVQLVKH